MSDDYTPPTEQVFRAYGPESARAEFDRWLERVKGEAKAEALEEAALAVNQDLADRFFAAGGQAEEWTMHKRKTWADGASMALHEVRNRAAAIRAASETEGS